MLTFPFNVIFPLPEEIVNEPDCEIFPTKVALELIVGTEFMVKVKVLSTSNIEFELTFNELLTVKLFTLVIYYIMTFLYNKEMQIKFGKKFMD